MIIFLYGEDDFRSLEKLKEIERKFLDKNSSGSGLSSFDFEENRNVELSEIRRAFGSKGLFFEKQLIIIKSLLASAPKEKISRITEFIKSLKNVAEDKELVVVFWERGKANERNELFKLLLRKAKSQRFEAPRGAKLNNWISVRLGEENGKVKISAGAIQSLLAFTGGDLRLVWNEIRKLANFKERGEINERDINLLVKEKISSNIFEAIDAISSGDKKLALKLFREQIRKGEDPVYILMMYVYQFRNFLKVSEYFGRGERNSYKIAKKTKLHPFVVKKVLGNITRFPLEKLKVIYKKLQTIDEKVKTGKGEVEIELDKFIVEI
jgi:DNA polymerase-3 subunit delta